MSLSEPSGVRLLDAEKVSPIRLDLSDAGTGGALDRFDEGFAAGMAAGRAASELEAGERSAAALRRLEEAGAALRNATEELRVRRRELLDMEVAGAAELALELTETLVGALPAHLDPSRLTELLDLVPGDDALPVLRLHPDDVATLEATISLDAEIVADPDLELGECLVEIGPMSIDARRGPALSRLRSVLVEPATGTSD